MTDARPASHAGSWYTEDRESLDGELTEYLSRVPAAVDGVGQVPAEGARVIIAPHAGYSYSGPAAAWAYKSLNLKDIKRVFILGPSHHVYLDGCALTAHDTYATPLGPLTVDRATTAALAATRKFSTMSPSTDSDEHSIEMHLPYTYKMLSLHFSPLEQPLPPIVPILVGALTTAKEKEYGALLAPYLLDPANAFVVSSDFCHWGSRFSYRRYLPSADTPVADSVSLSSSGTPAGQQIWRAIEQLDRAAMRAIETGRHDDFAWYLRETKNTICGRHPIGVVMAGLEEAARQRGAEGQVSKFKFVRYEQSSQCTNGSDSSVSYASAFAVL